MRHSRRRFSRNGLVFERIAQTLEQFAYFFGGEQVEQHQTVRLLRELVAVCAVVLRLEDQIETLNIAVPFPVVVPVEFTELFVALKLADDSVVMKRYIHPATDIAPSVLSPLPTSPAAR